MKFKKDTFPFFFITTWVWLLLTTCLSFGQEAIDSSFYYYKAIINPELPNDLPLGINYYTKKKQYHLDKKDTLTALGNLRLLAIGEFKIGNYFDSENHVVEALSLIETLRFKDTLTDARIGLYNQLGRIYNASQNPAAALRSFNKALAISRKTKDSIIILNNKANTYMDQLAYKKAIALYALLYKKSVQTKDSLHMAMVLDNLGEAQSRTGAADALKNLMEALYIRKEKKYLAGLYSSYRNLSAYYTRENNGKIAKSYADTALQVSKELNSSSYKLDALSYFMKTNEDPRVRQYKVLADSIAEAKQMAENKNAFLKYNVAEEQKKTQASILLQEIEARKKLLYQFLAVVILIAFIASFFIYRYRYRKAKIEEVYRTETRIAKKVHDEVANDMYKVMTSLENNPDIDPVVLDELEKIYSKTRDISRENSAIDLDRNYGQQLNDLLLGYKNHRVTVVTLNLLKINWEEVSDIKKTAIYRALQELMTNMRKHSEASSVALIFSKEGSKIHINYSDNGVGCELFKKNGLQNTETRIASINGSISFESKKGAGFKATLIV